MVFINVGLIIIVFFIGWFFVCVQQKNYGLVDIAWGIGMSTVAIFLWVYYNPDLQIMLSLWLIIFWGLRLGFYLGKRNWGKPEDYRYVEMRKRWGLKYPLSKAFLNVFVLQGILLFLMMFSSMNAVSKESSVNYHFLIIGIIVALFGLGFEIVADYQLEQFKKQSQNKGKLMTKGVWSLSRHPNYFGEVVFWWGVFITSYQGTGSLVGLISPLLITVLINYVSGVPLLEKKYSLRSDFIEYAMITPRLVPFIGTKVIKK